MNRVVVVSTVSYPRGGATANYLQYLLSAFQEIGYETIIIAEPNKEFVAENSECYLKSRIISCYYNSKSKIAKRLMNGKMYPYYIKKVLKELSLAQNDIVIPLGDYRIHEAVLSRRNRDHYRTVACPLEWFPENYFSSKKRYLAEKKYFEGCLPRHDYLLPISTHISEHFTTLGVPNTVVPIMADTSEFVYTPKMKKSDKYKFILTANGAMKDSLDEMLKGLASVNVEKLQAIEFHLCGVKEEKIEQILNMEERRKLKNVLIRHDWLRYDELTDLFNQMHYILLARPITQVTLSNFPSKIPEALCYGIVPVVSRVGDYTNLYLQDGKESFVFDGCTAKDCCNAIERAVSVPFEEWLQMSHAARKMAEERFDYHNWISVLKSVVEKMR